MAGRTSVRLTMCGLCVMIRSKHELVDSVFLVAELLKKSVLKSPSIINFTTQLLVLRILSLISSQ